MSFSLPPENTNRIVNLCATVRRTERFSLEGLASLLGHLSWAAHAVPYARSHFRALQRSYTDVQRKKANMKELVRLAPASCQELDWWMSHVSRVNVRSFSTGEPDLVIFRMPPEADWEAVCDDVITRGPWLASDEEGHINELELQTAFFGLAAFANNSCGI